jgi:tRNA-specific 2-thiouridylase
MAVLMSGGVDSSAAALILKEAGYDITGITAKMWEGGSRCCDLDDIYRAQRVCHKLGAPHVVLDLTPDFERHVVDPFVRAYMEGRTPNPCAWCNREVKLGRLANLAVRAGFDRVATGHYARIRDLGGNLAFAEPADSRKSQVYFLSLVRPEAIGRLEFPLQDLTKDDAARKVRDRGLPVREGESQDLCFASSGSYEELLGERAGDAALEETRHGDVLDRHGQVIGTHRGHFAYTVGQRFGIKGRRCYVIEKRAASNEIVVAEREEALMNHFVVSALNSFVPFKDLAGRDLKIKYRYNSPQVPARVTNRNGDRLEFATSELCFAPAPGQILACFKGDCLVLGGVIESAGRQA